MSSSHKALKVIAIGVVIMTLLAFLVLTGVSAAFSWMYGGGNGSGPSLCQVATPGTGSAASTTISGGNAPICLQPSAIGAHVVAWARAMANALYVNPSCGGRISYPDCYYTWYKAPGTTYPLGVPTFPHSVIRYGQQICPGCSAWANGNYQCVSFVR